MEHAPNWCPDGWTRHSHRHGEHAHAFYVIDHGTAEAPLPSVLLMHEFPGISDNLVALADVLAEDFRVVVPSILGRDGSATATDSLRQICVRKEVHILARSGVSRSVEWLRDFADEHVALGTKRAYGVIGMCFTGNFALALAVDPRVTAAVVAQPALPVWPGVLGLSDEDRAALDANRNLRVQGNRFRRDCLSAGSKLYAAKDLLGSHRMQVFELTEPRASKHSTLTGRWRSDDAVERTRAFLRDRLTSPASAAPEGQGS